MGNNLYYVRHCIQWANTIDGTSRWTTKRNEVGTERGAHTKEMDVAKMREELNKFDDFKNSYNT